MPTGQGDAPAAPLRGRTGEALARAAGAVLLVTACTATAAAQSPARGARTETVTEGYLEARWAGADLAALAAALRAFHADHGTHPVGDVPRQLTPRYLAPAPRVDPWGRAYRFDLGAERPRILSDGPDRRAGTADDLVRFVQDDAARAPEAEPSLPEPTTVAPASPADDEPRPPSGDAQATTWSRLGALAEALEAFRRARGHYPVSSGIDGLRAALVPEHVRPAAWTPVDAWGRPWRYRATDIGTAYSLASAGGDGEFERLLPLDPGPVAGEDRDLVVADGRWVRWPAAASGGSAERVPTTTTPHPAAKRAEPAAPPPPPADGRSTAGGGGALAATEARLRQLAELLSAYRAQNGHFPEGDDAARILRRSLSTSVPATDAWGHPLRYLSRGSGRTCVLVSGGADGRLDHALEEYTEGARPSAGRGRDIVVRDGRLLE